LPHLEGVEENLAKKPNYSLKNNRWLYVGFVALGVIAVWFGVMLGNFLLNKVAEADPLLEDNLVISSTSNLPEESEQPATTVSVDYPDTTAPNIGGTLYRVRVGSYSTISQARAVEADLKASGFETYVIGTGSGPFYVQVGAFSEKANAEALKNQIEIKGYEVYIMQ